RKYALDFNLGNNYRCSGSSCLNKEYSSGIEEHETSYREKIKLKLMPAENENNWHHFKIETINSGREFCINFLNGFGISFVSSSLFLIVSFIFSYFKQKSEISCPFCYKTYSSLDKLKNHIKRSHATTKKQPQKVTTHR
ncbi:hypothetical protein JXC34_05100, partial [Candidatus Woesearchaeota archaeon]|nr:hypothetical protein [Candidatus Woesearchaeota archaeon]